MCLPCLMLITSCSNWSEVFEAVNVLSLTTFSSATDAIRATDGKRVCGYKVSVEASHGRKSKRKRYLEDVRCYK